MPSNHLILCCPLLLLLSFFPNIKVFPMSGFFTSVHRSTGASGSASVLYNEYSGLISFRIDWLDLKVQETLESLLQHPSSKPSVLWCLAFFVVLSHLYMTTTKTIALTLWTFVDKMMSLLFNILSRFVIAFLLRSKCL